MIDGPKNVEATFTPPAFRLTVAAAGNGAVSFRSGGDLVRVVLYSSPLRAAASAALTATPSPGAGFAGWGGACAGAGTTCTVAMSAARAVTALFSGASGQPLAVATSGEGTVGSSTGGISCGSRCCGGRPTGSQ